MGDVLVRTTWFVFLLLPHHAASRAVELSEDNFKRLVFDRKDGGPSFVKFYAPWCQHCQKLAPDWQKLEKKYEAFGTRLLIGSVDCSDGPPDPAAPGQGGHNPLCKKYKALSLPTLISFHPPSKKGMVYDGNRTATDLLAYAAEIGSACSLSKQDECTEEQKDLLSEYGSMSYKELRDKSREIEAKAEMARMQMMMTQMQMQQIHQEGTIKGKEKDAQMDKLAESAKEHADAISAVWEAESPALRAMKLALAEKKRDPKDKIDDEWSKVHELGGEDDDDFDEFDPSRFDPRARGGRHSAPAKPKPKPKKKPKVVDGPCEDAGPWPCKEAGCPSASVTCQDLKGDCKERFSDVFASPPKGLAKARIWKQCPKTCERCAADGGSASAKDEV